MSKTACLLITAVALAGCASSKEATYLRLPAAAGDAVEELRKLQVPIVAALRDGNPAACDEQLHAAMYYADHLPSVARRQELAAARLQEVTAQAKQLFDLLKAAHDGSHGGQPVSRDADQFAAEMSAALDAIQAAVR